MILTSKSGAGRRALALLTGVAMAAPVSMAAWASGGSGGGMPQFRGPDFAPQLVWLAICFVVLYFLLSRVAVPRIAETLEARERRIGGDLELAAKLKEEAEKVLAEYEKALADARVKAHETLEAARAAVARETAERGARMDADLNRQAAEAEARIKQAKTAAMAEVRQIAAESAAAIASQLLGGMAIDPNRAAGAVDQVMGGRG